MSKYNTFLAFFIICITAFIFFMIYYIQAIFTIVLHADEYDKNNSLEVLKTLFSPSVIITVIILGISAIQDNGNRICCQNKTVSDGEKALWIIGFIIIGFITAILFLILAKSKKLAE